MRIFFLLILAAQCGQPKNDSDIKVRSAHYTKFIAPANGDRGITFRLELEAPPEDLYFKNMTMNGMMLSPEITDITEKGLTIEATKILPGNRPIDPLPPGEPGNPLFFEEEFEAWLFWEKSGQKDSLMIDNWKEIKPEKLPN